MIKVKPLTNWLDARGSYDYFTRNRDITYKNITLTEDKDADYFVVINYTNDPVVRARTILFYMEPSAGVAHFGTWARPDRGEFLQVRSHDLFPNNMEWHLVGSVEELSTKKYIKPFTLSAVVSNKYYDPGHKKRIDFLRLLDAENAVHIYGKCKELNFKNYRGELPYMNKNPALFSYKYHFAAENHSEHNYITEKVVDAILSECLCFYWGAPNISEYFPEAVISLSLEDFNKDYNTIMKCIASDEHTKRLSAIREAKGKILSQYQILPTLHAVINSNRLRHATYCVNLKRRPDRRVKMIGKLARAGIHHYEFYNAVDGKNMAITPEILKLFRGNDFGSKLGVMGCALSHYNIWKTVPKDKYVFIMEDDLEFRPNFARDFDPLVISLYEKYPEWDLIFLSYHAHKEPTEENLEIRPLELNNFIGGTHCYLISGSGARKLCEFIGARGIQHGIDYIPKKYREDMKLNVYELSRHMAYAGMVGIVGSGDTDIQILGDNVDFKNLYSWKDLKVALGVKCS